MTRLHVSNCEIWWLQIDFVTYVKIIQLSKLATDMDSRADKDQSTEQLRERPDQIQDKRAIHSIGSPDYQPERSYSGTLARHGILVRCTYFTQAHPWVLQNSGWVICCCEGCTNSLSDFGLPGTQTGLQKTGRSSEYVHRILLENYFFEIRAGMEQLQLY